MKHPARPYLRWFVPFTALSLACSGGGGTTTEADPQLAGCEVELSEVAVYQSLKISLGKGDTPVSSRSAELIAGKPALFRVFVTPTVATPLEAVTVRLTIDSSAGHRSYERTAAVSGPSRDDVPGSTFDLAVPAAELQFDARAAVEIVAPAHCQGLARTRFPRTGEVALQPRGVGPLRVRLVPLRYDADGSGRLPDTSPAQLQAFHDALLAMFPVPAVELSVREPVPTSVRIEQKAGWASLLDVVRQTRAGDRAPEDVYYFGLVAPADTHAIYCGTGCTTGVSFTPRSPSGNSQVSLGLGFTGPVSVDAVVHELGHAHGRAHAPCGRPDRPDPAFPYPEALIGVWGYDARGTGQLQSPESTRDIMGYCGPRWVSDYTYRGLTDRSAAVNRLDPPRVASSLIDGTAPATETIWRTLILGAGGQLTWGRATADVPPEGTPVTAGLVGPAGEALGELAVQEIAIADSDERLFWIPEDAGGATSLVLPGASPVPFPPPSPPTP